MNNFMYVIDETEANKYIAEGFVLLQNTKIGNKLTWVFSINSNDKKLNFKNTDKSKVLFTNKLMF